MDLTEIPYNRRCRVSTPSFFREGVFRPAQPEDLEKALSRAIEDNWGSEIPMGESRFSIHPPVRFLFYSDGFPTVQVYDSAQLTVDSILKVVPTFNASYDPVSLAVNNFFSNIVAQYWLWHAGVKGPTSFNAIP